MKVVKAFCGPDVIYYQSLGSCCKDFGIRYQEKLENLIEEGGLAPDGKTFFDWPTDEELQLINSGEIRLNDSR